MKIHNVRLGFANNSSSSHSIVFFPGARDVPSESGADSFGWDPFTLASAEAKRHYLHAILRHSLRGGLGEKYAVIVANELAGTQMTEADRYGIDHQSTWTLPVEWKGVGVDLEFFAAFRDHLLRDDVVVLGGNDNSGEHPDEGRPASPASALPQECDNTGLVARRDGAYWTLFSRATGAKIRLSFDDAQAPHKASRPELVDLKITDWCDTGCAYCYQGSTKAGKHASIDAVKMILNTLAAWKVFEVAIGGGEPTAHPWFNAIIEHAHDLGVTPNFTTRNLSWLLGPMGAMILSKVGSFAFSVDTADDVDRLNDAVEPSLELRHKASVQYVIGVDAKAENLRQIVRAVEKYKFPLTLLGYKSTKRGATFGEKVAGHWIDVVKDAKTRIAIDTVLADKHYDELIARGVSPWLVTRKDGAFSMYVDCVEGTMHRSSYEATEAAKLPMRPTWPGAKTLVVDASAAEQVFAGWT